MTTPGFLVEFQHRHGYWEAKYAAIHRERVGAFIEQATAVDDEAPLVIRISRILIDDSEAVQ